MDRAELTELDRDTLIARAEALNVPRARILTRPELIDEIVTASARPSAIPPSRGARGFFGRARDLLARVVERGLHLPDAMERIRTATLEPPTARTLAAPMPTVTLAGIYAAQGHRDRAIETLENVLEREPEHAAAMALLRKLRATEGEPPVPGATLLPPEDDDAGMAGVASSSSTGPNDAATAERRAADAQAEAALVPTWSEAPARDEVDACIAIWTSPTGLFVFWQVSAASLAFARARLPAATVALRVVVVMPTWEGPSASTRDVAIAAPTGDAVIENVPDGAVVRVAVGLREGETFVPVAHSPALELPPAAVWPVPATALLRRTIRGAERVNADDPDAPVIAHAVEQARRRADVARV